MWCTLSMRTKRPVMSFTGALLPAGIQKLLCMCSHIVIVLLSSMLTWPGCLLRRGHRTLPELRETAARLRPQLWSQGRPVWKQIPLLTDAPAELSRLKSHILNRPGNPAVEHTALVGHAVVVCAEVPEIFMNIEGMTRISTSMARCHLKCYFDGTVRACGSCLLEPDSWTLLRLYSTCLRVNEQMHQGMRVRWRGSIHLI